jgi:hypothetical protein
MSKEVDNTQPAGSATILYIGGLTVTFVAMSIYNNFTT